MSGKLLKSLALAMGIGVLGILAGDRIVSASTVPAVCLDCSGPNCSCKPEPFQVCDGASEKLCKCNGEAGED